MEQAPVRFLADSKRKLNEAYRLLMQNIDDTGVKAVGVDTEGSGLDPHTLKLWSVQFGTKDIQILIPTYDKNGERLDIGKFKELLEDSNITKIFHRASYDLKVLWRHGWEVENIFCTRTAEQLLTAGLLENTALAGTLKRYFDVDMSKEERTDFYKDEDGLVADNEGTLSIFAKNGYVWDDALLNYGLGDVEHLVPLMTEQKKRLKKYGMERVADELEMPLVVVTALLEYRGVMIDRAETEMFQLAMQTRAEQEKKVLVDMLNVPYQKYAMEIYRAAREKYDIWHDAHQQLIKETNKERDPENKRRVSQSAMERRKASKVLAPFQSKPKPPKQININSTFQVRAALGHLDDNPIFLPDMRKETLQNAADEHPIINLLIEQKKYDKLAKMAEIYEKINAITSRIHTTFNQIVDTGRYSSRDPNLQNIPARSDEGTKFRSLFIASPGAVFIGADYSAIELVIIGVLSKDENLLYAINNVDDLHCFTMSKALNCSYEALVEIKDAKTKIPIPNIEAGIGHSSRSIQEVNKARKAFNKRFHFPDLIDEQDLGKWVRTLRTHFKNMTYGVAYQISKFGLSKRFHSTQDTAQDFIDLLFKVYPTTEVWLKNKSNFSERYGFSQTVSGRKRFYKKPRQASQKDIQEAVTQFLKNHYDADKNHKIPEVDEEEFDKIWSQEKKRLEREYFATINRIRRQGANQPIQGASADITKLAMLLFENWWRKFAEEQDIDYRRYGLVLTVHDELIVEVPLEYAEVVRKQLKRVMEKAAHTFLGNSVKIVVEPKIMTHWEK